uniref:beta-aspartyl-peptidase n=1 Tax=Ningiella ruwaisensis TaxID=2364274 RepID=UPI0010A0AAFB|nr:beta-aspartyl-peptidase [Ningiella ruwaisensis]
MFITLIKQAQVFSPAPLGICDVLIANNKIQAIEASEKNAFTSIEDGKLAHVIDAQHHYLVPGFIDSLVHISGGGGEGGFHTRTPEMPLQDAINAGVTTIIAGLGTDSTTRTLSDMLAKARALKHYGLSVYAYTGSYHYPAKTITNSITDDIMLIEEFIGLGELAIADHRSSQLHWRELAKAAAQARVGGMLSGKAGVISIHVGDSNDKLSLLEKVIERSDIPASQFLPTHINRNKELLDAGMKWTEKGGFIDVTTSTNAHFIAQGEIPAAKAIAICAEKGVSFSQMTMSSDGNASLPVFDKHNHLVGLEVGKVQSLHSSFCELVKEHKIALQEALKTVTSTPAEILRLTNKGNLIVGADADALLLNQNDLSVETLISTGKLMLHNKQALVLEDF